MEFGKFLNFLHKVNETISKYLGTKPHANNEELMNIINPNSKEFNKTFPEYQNLSPEYKKLYQNNIQDIYLYKDKFSKENLIEKDGFQEALRRISEKISKDEFGKILDEPNSNEKLPLMPFEEFINQINKNPDKMWNGFKFEDFNYEELKKITPEDLDRIRGLRQDIYNESDKLHEIRRKIMLDKLSKEMPEFYNKFKDTVPENKLLDKLFQERRNLSDEDWDKFHKIDMDIYKDKEYLKQKQILEDADKKLGKLPEAIRFYTKPIDIITNIDNGIDFPKLKHDENGKELEREKINCECDVNIEKPLTFNNLIESDKNIIQGLASASLSTDEYSSRGHSFGVSNGKKLS
jgi:hypothetical protein